MVNFKEFQKSLLLIFIEEYYIKENIVMNYQAWGELGEYGGINTRDKTVFLSEQK